MGLTHEKYINSTINYLSELKDAEDEKNTY